MSETLCLFSAFVHVCVARAERLSSLAFYVKHSWIVYCVFPRFVCLPFRACAVWLSDFSVFRQSLTRLRLSVCGVCGACVWAMAMNGSYSWVTLSVWDRLETMIARVDWVD